jgi:hypothetical protein
MLSLVLYVLVSLSLGMLLQSTLRFGAQNAGKRPRQRSGHWAAEADRWYQQQTRRDLSGGKTKASGFALVWIVFIPVAYSTQRCGGLESHSDW